MVTRRGSSNKNQQPNSRDRLRLKQHCLDRDGDGVQVKCAGTCGGMVTIATASLDRFPVAGYDGGTYRQSNVRLMCVPCNSSDGSMSMHRRLGHKVSS